MEETFEDGCTAAYEPTPGDLTDGYSTGLDDDSHPLSCVVAAE